MFSKIWMINIVLFAAILFTGLKALQVWTGVDQFSVGSEGILTPESEGTVKPTHIKQRSLSESAYSVVVDKNLFSQDRQEYKEEIKKPSSDKKTVEVKTVAIDGKKIDVQGIIKVGDFQRALINNPDKSLGKDRIWIQKGEHVGNLIVAKIEQDSVIFNENGNSVKVLLYDKDKKNVPQIASKESTSPNVISAGSSPPKEDLPPAQKNTDVDTPKSDAGNSVLDRLQNLRNRQVVNPFVTKPQKK